MFDLDKLVNDYLVPFGLKILMAVVIWIVGGIVINVVARLVRGAMTRRAIDPTLVRYTESTLRIALRIALIISILSVCGIETTSFAALLAAAGVAIGAAWSGLLSNFASGIFLIVLRPFKTGDMISAGGVTGVVDEIGLFVTTMTTADNLRVYVGNTKVFSDNITVFDANAFRRVDLTAQLAHTVDVQDAVARLKTRVAQIPNVMPTPAVDVAILEFNPSGPVLAVRPYCHNRDYWQVYFDTNRAIAEVGGTAHWPVPAPRQIFMPPPGEMPKAMPAAPATGTASAPPLPNSPA
ncbi:MULTISPECIES: mechanosensitive ion channel family protein [Pandoraea]|jgi:small conductance mechanosensitive channel|uniref:Small-conductance mechanosensitive channel n=1 Tax=Pandoraea pnomenusa TaxID=93220 RepID=A0A378YKA0_9BURK|nr:MULTISPECIES: mechanosensitive ion channel family protein [Pandoraea]AHB04809.1 mechanosensitive ion channel protein MscS [Pandoraea pnomenusa 3kgm]AHB74794.1 mechanosensitive ion channel protein MscS [Pandoraea pnomenusa]AHN76835.1 mechanosensitive ion channel protein MscS [Pandoraea pnomenusa]AIU26560.1 mechanosensitive ion channel protein MscS [Pandoraea pnomenusa]ANC43781.1 mechanosensitive ion channel protein MscS [Pandoraea pnomenusa]